MLHCGSPGIYRLYRRFLEPDGSVHMRLMGRFALISDQIVVMEDHEGIVAQMFQPGEFTSQDLRRMEQCEHSAYWHLVHEENIQNGFHPEYMDSVEGAPSPEPWTPTGEEKPPKEQ